MARLVLSSFLFLLFFFCHASSFPTGYSMQMKTSPPTFVSDVTVRRTTSLSHFTQVKPSVFDVESGVTIPMNGGTLTVGAFFVNVSIGGSQTFPALVDTGSSNIWVTGFDTSKSESYQPLGCDSRECKRCNINRNDEKDCLFGQPVCNTEKGYTPSCGWGITYGGGGTIETGVYGSDRVCFAGSSLCTSGAPFGHRVRSFPKGPNALGAIIGLTFPRNACNPSCVTTLYEALLAENSQLSQGFSMCLTTGRGGVIDFGFVNKSRLSAPFQTMHVTHRHWYNLAVTDVTIDGEPSGLPHYAYSATNDIIGSFVDSGTTVLALGPLPFASLSNHFVTRYGHLAGVKELWSGSCVPASQIGPIVDQLPSIDVHIDPTGTYSPSAPSNIFGVPPTSYLLKAGNQYCLGVAEISGIGAILGDVFLENYVTLYNPIEGTVGLAPIVQGSCHL